MGTRRFFMVFLAFGAVTLIDGCSEISMVMKSDASFSEKVRQFGSIVGRQFDQQSGTRADAVNKYNYTGRGELLEIDSASLTPEIAPPGSTVESSVQYTVLLPNEAHQVKISETRTLVLDKEIIPLSSREVAHDQGTRLTKFKFTLPSDLAKGRYVLITTLSYGTSKTTAKNTLKVI